MLYLKQVLQNIYNFRARSELVEEYLRARSRISFDRLRTSAGKMELYEILISRQFFSVHITRMSQHGTHKNKKTY
jgi:hypothetical protein